MKYLSFLTLGVTTGVASVSLPNVLDGASSAISIPGGFPFGDSIQTVVYVSFTILCTLWHSSHYPTKYDDLHM